jgi:beta-lactamase regulating signal transducer with metallopeptidase domain
LNSFVHFAVENLVSSLPVGIAIAALAWGVTRLLHRSGAGSRFSIWLAALGVIVLFPWLSALQRAAAPAIPALSGAKLIFPESVALGLLVAWLVGALFGIMQLGFGLLRLRRIRRSCQQVEAEQLDPVVRATLEEFQSERHVTLCISEAVRVPAALGYFRPVVVFPKWVLAELKPLELNGILLHELAHLRRYDDWTNLAQKLVRAMFFFHPAVWIIDSRLTLEREMACDDAALASNLSPRAYAESLLGLAEKSFLKSSIHLAQAAVGQVRQLRYRLAAIVRKDRGAPKVGSFRWAAGAVLACSALVVTYGITHVPRLVAFAPSSSELATSSASAKPIEFVSWQTPTNADQNLPAASQHEAAELPAMTRVEPLRVRQGSALESTQQHLLVSYSISNKPGVKLVPVKQIALLSRAQGAYVRPSQVLAKRLSENPNSPVMVLVSAPELSPEGYVIWKVTIFQIVPVEHRLLTEITPEQI